MPSFLTRSHTLVWPLVVLLVVLFEEVCAYEMRNYVATDEGRALAMMTLNALAFTVAADKVNPWMKRLIVSARARSRRSGGALGVWLLFGLAYGLLFLAYVRLERLGPAGLIPSLTQR